jgi:hypothetical protein
MRRHWQYLKYVLRHKCFVFIEGIKLGVPIWALILHDWDKFTPSMWMAYSHTFYAPNGDNQYKPDPNFNKAWNNHQKLNKHHWQYWVLHNDSGNSILLEIPTRHLRELLADWRGAGRALGFPDTARWYLKNRDNIQMNDKSKAWVCKKLGIDFSDKELEAAKVQFEVEQLGQTGIDIYELALMRRESQIARTREAFMAGLFG